MDSTIRGPTQESAESMRMRRESQSALQHIVAYNEGLKEGCGLCGLSATSVLPPLCACFPSSIYCLRDFNNFHSFLCILSVIESAAVSRLEWSDKVNKVCDPRSE